MGAPWLASAPGHSGGVTGRRAWPAGTPGPSTPKSCLCPRLPAEPQVPREGGGTLFSSSPGGPQLVAAVWAGLPQRQQLAVPRAPGQWGPAHRARRPGKGEPCVLETVQLPPGASVTKDHKLRGLKWQQCVILEAEVQNHSAEGALRPPKALEGSSRATSGFWRLQALLALWPCHSSLFSLPLSSHGLLPSVCVSKSPSFSCGDTGHWV